MNKNRIAAFALAGVMVLGLVACSPTDPKPTDTSTPEVTEPAYTSEPEQTAPAEPDDQEPQEPAETTADTGPVEPTTTEIPDLFTSVNETVYATTTVNIREGFSADTDKVGSLSKGQSIVRTGIGTGDAEGWSEVEFNGQTAYISSDYLSTTKPAAPSSKPSGNSNSSSGSTSSGNSSGQSSSGQQSSGSSGGQTQQPSTSGGNSYRDTAIPPEMQSKPENWIEEGEGLGSASGDAYQGEFHDKQEEWAGIQ